MPRRKKNSHENQSRSSLSINKEKPQQRYAANARERARMRVLSRAFCRLKTTLPWVPADTKLSKLDTLRLAASYIAHLKGILREEPLGNSENSLHPAMSMTWPFGFNRPIGGSTGGGSQEGGSLDGSEDEDEDDDGESISSCTWEEVTPTAKDCVHLDTHGRARGKGNNNNSPTSQNPFHNNNNNISNVNLCHIQPSNKLISPNPGMMTSTHLENTSPSSTQAEIHVGLGVATNNTGGGESFVADVNNGYIQNTHSHHHPHHQQNHNGDNQLHHLASSGVQFGFGNDLMSIG